MASNIGGESIKDSLEIPPSLVELAPILRVASEIESYNPRVADLCRSYAYEKAHKLDPTSSGHGVLQFKTGLLQRQERKQQYVPWDFFFAPEATTSGGSQNSDGHAMQAFYRQYYMEHIQGWQNSVNADGTRLTKSYQTAAVLFEVLKAVCLLDTVEVADEILKAHAHVAGEAEIYTFSIPHVEVADEILEAHTHVAGEAEIYTPSIPHFEVDDEILEAHAHVAGEAEIYNFNRPRGPRQQTIMFQREPPNPHKIPLRAIKKCTEDFNERNFIGVGGYGRVYKGFLTWADRLNELVAVKRLDISGYQGKKEFHTELTMLLQYRHKNIITLIGFCDDNNEMILVYEYASRGSLDTYLRDTAISDGLSWPQLLKICIGVASALNYLHNHVAEKHRIIHRDIKSANVLLDDNWNAKLSDFGLAKIGLANQQNTFVITNVAGTHGYNDPQYEKTGLLTKESDVYSFGVVLFEVLCGRLACAFSYHDERRFLPHLARIRYKNGELDTIIDHRIKKDIKPRTLSMFSAIAYQCLQETREERPTIADVAYQLKEAMKFQLEDE